MKNSISSLLKLICIFILSTKLVLAASLPIDIEWLTNTTSAEWSSPDAQKGGELRFSISSFPPTLRTVGPNSNNYFRSFLIDNQMPLVERHPNTGEIIPMLASHWAYDKNGKTVYYKIKKNALWSNGQPVTADDFLFALQFNRSKYINAPWNNTYYNKEIEQVIKFDTHTIAIVGARIKPQDDLHYHYALQPRSKYFHQLNSQWTHDFNWKVEPNTGPYQISNIRKGILINFKRKPGWWAQNDRFLRNRFNVNNVSIKVVRNPNIAYKYFENGELDLFNLSLPKLWYEKTNSPLFQKGFIHKLSFYNKLKQGASGLFLNLDNEILNNIDVRKAIAHSLNFDKIIHHILRNEYQRLPRFHTGYEEYSNNQVSPLKFNLEQATKYLNSAGWNNKDSSGILIQGDKRLSLIVAYGNKLHKSQILSLASDAKKVGIELKPQFLEPTAFYNHVIEKKHDIAWLGWSTNFRPVYWQHFHSDNAHKPNTNNITNLADPDIDHLIDLYRDTTEKEEAIRLAHILESKIAAKTLFIPSTMIPFTRVGFWRWLKLPNTIATKSSSNIFNPFHPTQGGLFWVDGKSKINTLSAKRSGEGFEANTTINRDFE